MFQNIAGFLKNAVGNGLFNDPDDVRVTKRNLSALGFLNEEDEQHGYITRDLDSAVKRFQKNHNLQVDGELYPGGETERSIFQLLEKRDPQEVFGKQFDDSTPGIGFGTGVASLFQQIMEQKSKSGGIVADRPQAQKGNPISMMKEEKAKQYNFSESKNSSETEGKYKLPTVSKEKFDSSESGKKERAN